MLILAAPWEKKKKRYKPDIFQIYLLNLSRSSSVTLISCKQVYIFCSVDKQVVWMCDDL